MIWKAGAGFRKDHAQNKHESVIGKSGFFRKDHAQSKHESMIRKSGNRFSEKIMLKQTNEIMSPCLIGS
jgi:hypothetical protein